MAALPVLLGGAALWGRQGDSGPAGGGHVAGCCCPGAGRTLLLCLVLTAWGALFPFFNLLVFPSYFILWSSVVLTFLCVLELFCRILYPKADQ